MKVIVDDKRSKVFFDEEKKEYIKTFNSKLENKIKFFLRLRRYPGKNFLYIANKLEELNIKIPKIISASNYSVTTKDIDGVILSKYLKQNSKKLNDIMIKKFLDLIVTVLNHNIYFGDFNLGNFIVKDEELYALDLEDYRYVKFLARDNTEALRRLRRTLKNEEWVSYIESKLK